MKISKSDTRKIIEGVLPELAEINVQTVVKRTVEGRSLIGRNVVKDIGGEQIKPGGLYTVDEVIRVPVDHRRRLSDLIKSAADYEDMTGKLAAYLVKNSKQNKTEKQNEI